MLSRNSPEFQISVEVTAKTLKNCYDLPFENNFGYYIALPIASRLSGRDVNVFHGRKLLSVVAAMTDEASHVQRVHQDHFKPAVFRRNLVTASPLEGHESASSVHRRTCVIRLICMSWVFPLQMGE